jgi:VIT1/CCC1 family predicted Fe2+/Mn2+ transporter
MIVFRQSHRAYLLMMLQALVALLIPSRGITYQTSISRIARRVERDTSPASTAANDNNRTNYRKHNRDFVLRVIQPGLAGLMDGSVSTLAPIFAVAFATHKPFTTFLVGMAAATGAGISMAFAEALSDDGRLTGRGNPIIRGGITGLMTFVGGAGHTLPFLVPNIHVALSIAYIVVTAELAAIAWIRHRYFGTNVGISIIQVVGGGALVFAAAFFLGNA